MTISKPRCPCCQLMKTPPCLHHLRCQSKVATLLPERIFETYTSYLMNLKYTRYSNLTNCLLNIISHEFETNEIFPTQFDLYVEPVL